VAIREFSAGRERRGIVCIGWELTDAERKLLQDREFKLLPSTLAKVLDPEQLVITDSIIIAQDPDKPARILQELEPLAPTLLDYDCRVYVRVASNTTLQGSGRTIVVNALSTIGLPVAGLSPQELQMMPSTLRERDGNPLAPFVYVCGAALDLNGILQIVQYNPGGQRPSTDLRIHVFDPDGQGIKLSTVKEILLRRAFADCQEMRLHQLPAGLSGVMVFRAHANPAAGLHSDWPMAYLVKIGDRKKIATEYEKYQEHALLYIPFELAPRLILARCGLGAREGIIVGDFIDQSEPLWRAAHNDRGARAVGHLFTRTLRAWRHAALPDIGRTLPEALADLFPETIPSHREPLIRPLGAKLNLIQLRELLSRCDSKPVLTGTIHGDLNAGNVLVRNGEAILIDFEQLKEGRPLVYDAASVEAALLVEGFQKDSRDIHTILKSIESLYATRDFFELKKPCHPSDDSAWFYDCVHEVRIHAGPLQLGPNQYGTALALALIKKSCNPYQFNDKRDQLRALAYVLAERILRVMHSRDDEVPK
jgi:hypothetical protein